MTNAIRNTTGRGATGETLGKNRDVMRRKRGGEGNRREGRQVGGRVEGRERGMRRGRKERREQRKEKGRRRGGRRGGMRGQRRGGIPSRKGHIKRVA